MPVLLAVAATTRVTELAVLGGTAAGVLLAGSISVVARGRRLGTLRASRHLRATPHAGDDLVVVASVTCSGPARAPLATISDGLDGRRASVRSAPLAPGAHREITYALPTLTRGRAQLEPLTATVLDPFGLLLVSRVLEPARHTLVYPRREVVELDGGRPRPGHPGASGVRPSALGNDEFFALRPYQLGDDLRRVHWRTTARVGVPVVRREEGRPDPTVDLLVDLTPNERFERVVGAAASLAAALAAHGTLARIQTLDGLPLTPGRGGLAAVFEALAVVEPAASGPGAPRPRGPAIIVTARHLRSLGSVVVEVDHDVSLQVAWDRAARRATGAAVPVARR